jgi:hypothetical protein
MIIKASGRSALIMTAGLVALLACPVLAATAGDDSADSKSEAAAPVTHRAVRHVSHHRRSAHPKSHEVATKIDDDKKAAPADAASADNKALPDIPPSIANARAQMLLAGAQINAAAAIPPGINVSPAAPDSSANASSDNGTFMVAADQLNDVDRTLQEGNSATTQTTTAASSPPPAPATTMTGESSVWDQTSLIGKIFIGFGALLTMASAARMFIT